MTDYGSHVHRRFSLSLNFDPDAIDQSMQSAKLSKTDEARESQWPRKSSSISQRAV
jgi:hypothetical protein